MQTNVWLLWAFVARLAPSAGAKDFELTIFHINDFHVRFEETDKYSSRCSEAKKASGECFGGLARLFQAVEDLRKGGKNILFLNAGDMYQGTVWYTKFKSDVVWPFMNMMNFTASALGNHEFDDRPEGLLPLLQHANFDVLCANCNFSSLPEFNGLVKPHTIVEVGGRKVGIIGYTTVTTRQSSNPGNVMFSDELSAVKAEAKMLKGDGVDIIIGLGHAGYPMDKEIAREVPELDLVIGGHTHSFLYTGNDLPSIEKPEGGYPTMIQQPGTGRNVPVVQAYAYTKYLGQMNMKFDSDGEMVNFHGKPLLLDSSYSQNENILNQMKPWRSRLESIIKENVGSTKVLLESSRRKETNLGDFTTDAMLDWYDASGRGEITKYRIAVHNSGGIRVSLGVGNITSADILTVWPFGNTIDYLVLDAATVLDVLEVSAASVGTGAFLQVAGMKFTIDLRREVGKRILDLQFRSSRNPDVYEKVSGSTLITVYLNYYIAIGKDGYDLLIGKNQTIGVLDAEVIEVYFKKKSPVDQKVGRRITILRGDSDGEATEEGGIPALLGGALNRQTRRSTLEFNWRLGN